MTYGIATEEDGELDKYGNPISGDRLINCCYPDCGCDGSRLCDAENGASEFACSSNVEGMWSGKTKKQRVGVFALLGHLSREKTEDAP